jgi:flagellar biosynthesis chaperone FliJ
MAYCPNTSLKEWKDLVSAQGEDLSYFLWDKYKGNVPSTFYLQSFDAPQTITIDPSIFGATSSEERSNIQSIEELFQSDPELANIGTAQQYSDYLKTIFPNSTDQSIFFDTVKPLRENVFEYQDNNAMKNVYSMFPGAMFLKDGVGVTKKIPNKPNVIKFDILKINLKDVKNDKGILVANPKLKADVDNFITQLKEDIDQARQNDFGRKIFEAFTSEYQNSLMNEKSETSKLLKVIAEKEQKLAEAQSIISEKQSLVESRDQEIVRAQETAERREIMGELLNPLNKDQQEIMSELLESVQTVRLRTSFDKYLPSVLSGSTPEKKKALVEAKEITGNKETHSISSANSQADVIDIRRLAGLK